MSAVDPTRVVLRRCLQYMLDRLLVGVPALVLLIAAVLILRSQAVLLTVAFLLVLLVGNWFVEVWIPYRSGGATPGMRLLGLRTTTEWGTQPSLRAYNLRWLMLIIDSFPLCLIGVVVMAASPQHQRVGDLVARTLVVSARRTAAG